ncbi:MAG: AMP-binding protein [Sphingopyxis sp.]
MSDMPFPTPDQAVTRHLLERQAREHPDDLYMRFQDGSEWSFAEALDQAHRAAGALKRLGVEQGDLVLYWLPNGMAAVREWLGTHMLGGVFVPANLAYRGSLLRHVLWLADAKVGLVHRDLMPRLAEVERGMLEKIIVVGGDAAPIEGLELHDETMLGEAGSAGDLTQPIAPWDDMAIIFTSGTTGPSKAVMCSYAHMWTFYHAAMPAMIGRDYRHLAHLPIFHSGGFGCLYGQLSNAGSVVLVESFKTDQFWQIVRDHGANTTTLLGAMIPFLLSTPPSDDDRNHSLKSVSAVPYTADVKAFTARFGVGAFAAYSMTELANPVQSPLNPDKIGVAGRLRPGQHIRLVDEHDIEVPEGAVGEAILRCDQPWTMFSGYYKNPEATAEAWRNGWLHTGDLLRRDADGDYFFVDRRKDAIRRRGENISAYEVEQEIRAFDGVKEAAVIGVASDKTEDEVMACIMPSDGAAIDLMALTDFLATRLPHYMVPRYFRLMPDLPRTPTQKIQKYALRDDGVTADTWDREAAGIRLRRERIG